MRLPLEKLEAGMQVAGDVVDRDGRLLMTAGVRLTARHLRAFKAWGVLSALVEADEDETEGLDPAEEVRLTDLFCNNNPEDPLIEALLTATIARARERCALGLGNGNVEASIPFANRDEDESEFEETDSMMLTVGGEAEATG